MNLSYCQKWTCTHCCICTPLSQAEEHLTTEGDCSDTDDVPADDSDAYSSDLNAEVTEDDDDDDDFVDAGDEVEGTVDHGPWVTERRHSGDGQVRLSVVQKLSYFLLIIGSQPWGKLPKLGNAAF